LVNGDSTIFRSLTSHYYGSTLPALSATLFDSGIVVPVLGVFADSPLQTLLLTSLLEGLLMQEIAAYLLFMLSFLALKSHSVLAHR
jgi:hypothetical protein